ncbi:hypothetical protein H0H81_001258 [Sphagnurus paluster]|uniref:Uncharacterized protein n=1 Tax=Sphagnurus paluster TaxID=117069 RepID=A0A9P7GRJ9_9AGAR|nr:hypothetical protein H0H81_001258 [Sphagnurus paluster]
MQDIFKQKKEDIAAIDLDILDIQLKVNGLISSVRELEKLRLLKEDEAKFMEHGIRLAQRDGHPHPALPNLSSFKFGFIYGEAEDSVEQIGESFAALGVAWMQDTTRRQPLESLALYVCDVVKRLQQATADIVFSGVRDSLTKAQSDGTGGLLLRRRSPEMLTH